MSKLSNQHPRYQGKCTTRAKWHPDHRCLSLKGKGEYIKGGTANSLRIDYCDERVIQESSYISGAIPLTNTCCISYEGQYFSVLDHTSNI